MHVRPDHPQCEPAGRPAAAIDIGLARRQDRRHVRQWMTASPRRGDRRGRPAWSAPPFCRSAFPHGCDAVARFAAHEHLRHAARGHRALGRVAAAADAGSARRTSAALLRPRRHPGPSRHPQPRGHVRDPRLRDGTKRCSRSRNRSHPISNLQLVAFPQDGYFRAPGARRVPRAVRSTWASASSAAFRISSGRWRTAPALASKRCAGSTAADRGLPVDMHCDETDDPMSRHIETLAAETGALRPRRGGWRVRISPRCTRWTTTTSRSSSR